MVHRYRLASSSALIGRGTLPRVYGPLGKRSMRDDRCNEPTMSFRINALASPILHYSRFEAGVSVNRGSGTGLLATNPQCPLESTPWLSAGHSIPVSRWPPGWWQRGHGKTRIKSWKVLENQPGLPPLPDWVVDVQKRSGKVRLRLYGQTNPPPAGDR